MGVASVFLGAVALCLPAARRGTSGKSRSACADCDNCAVVADVCAARSNAERYLVWGAVVSAVALGVNIRLSIVHFIISAASTAMIVHVMLVDKKLDATLRAIDVLHGIRPYTSVLMLVCVALYFCDALGWRIPAFRRGVVRTAGSPSLSLSDQSQRKPELCVSYFATELDRVDDLVATGLWPVSFCALSFHCGRRPVGPWLYSALR